MSAALESWQGKTLSSYIDWLEEQGLNIIYSNDVVLDDFLVQDEPTGDDSIESLREALRPYDLDVTSGPGDTWLVLPAPKATQRNPAPAVPQPDLLSEIVVSSSVYSIRYEKSGSHVFLERDFATGLPDVGEEALKPLARLPGVTNGGISARSYVRGGVANEQLIMFDGLRLYEPYHLKDFQTVASTIDQNAVDGIDFYTASYQARYGDRMSGVVDISMREPARRRESEIGISLFNTWALSAGRFGGDERGDWLVSARRGNLDLVSRAAKSDLGTPIYSDVLSHIGWEWGDRTRLSANYLYSYDKIKLVLDENFEQARARYDNHVGWLKAQTDWTSRISSTTIVSHTGIRNSRNGASDVPGVMTGAVDDRRDFEIQALTQDWDLNPNESWMFRIGFDIKGIESNYHYDSTLQILPPFDQIFDNVPLLRRSYDLDPSGEQYSVYAEARWQPINALVLDFGLRWDRQTYSTSDRNEQRSPRLNALYRIGERTELRLGVGRFYQAQEINELQVEDGIDTFFAPQFADHVVAGVVHRFESGPSLRVEWYQKDYDRPAPRFENAFDTLVLIPELQIDRVRIDAHRAFVKGLELSVTSRENSKVLWWAGYAWSSTEDTVNGVKVSRSWDERHSLKAGFSTNWHGWDLSVAGSWHSGWPKTTLIVDSIELPDGTTELTATTSPRNRQSYADFHSLDVRASRSIALTRGELTTFMEVSNLYNRHNPCCTRYTMQTAADGSQLVDAKQNDWLPLVPSVGVVWKF